ncbi:exodeoxyribonuclease VII small subunit [Sphingobacterium sp. HJSM2_6]|uniref:exodeoxyribonuclease VII small subunit n=1 Tax=Sphingobacterium sp. HJSM2_6 TaxID=3366264 RepID=UPI003BE3250A
MSNQYTYQDAFEELQGIVSEIESGEIPVDELSVKIKRASDLLEICKAKLSSSEEDVNQLLQKLSAQKDKASEEEE